MASGPRLKMPLLRHALKAQSRLSLEDSCICSLTMPVWLIPLTPTTPTYPNFSGHGLDGQVGRELPACHTSGPRLSLRSQSEGESGGPGSRCFSAMWLWTAPRASVWVYIEDSLSLQKTKQNKRGLPQPPPLGEEASPRLI